MRPARYDIVIDKLCDLLTIGEETQASIHSIADGISEPHPAVAIVVKAMVDVGTLETRLEKGGVSGKNRQALNRAFYKLLGTADETRARMKKRGVTWNDYNPYFLKKKVKRVPATRLDAETTNSAPPLTRVEVADSPFAPLRVLKRDESRAQLELARRYRDQETFIAEQAEKFKSMGLKFDVNSVERERRPDLEAVAMVLPYVDAVIAENERLTQAAKTVYQPTRELQDANAKLRSQHEQIERLIREKQEIADAALAAREEYGSLIRSKNARIGELERELRALRSGKPEPVAATA